MKNWDWKHTLLSLCIIGTAASEGIANAATGGVALPWHLTAGAFLLAASVFGYISKSLTSAAGAILLFVASSYLAACSWLQSPQGGKAIATGIDGTVCVLNHSQEPIDQIVKDCVGVVASDVERVLSAHTAAMQREAAAKLDGGK